MRIKLPSFLDNHRARVSRGALIARQIVGYLGPGFFVTVGFIDPGNWATNVAAGSDFNYDLLWVVTLSTVILLIWQHMSAHLGIISGKCLAEAIHDYVSPVPRFIYGSTAIAACVATALAEILGGALGLNILLGVPVRIGAIATSIFVVGVIWFQRYASMEKLIVALVSAIGLCYLVELHLVKPDWAAAAFHSFAPKINSNSIVVAMGVLGAVVMPHNMYLHSEVIQSRKWKGRSDGETRRLLRFEFIDTLVAMLVGLAINSAMVIVAAAVFHRHGIHVTELAQASATLRPLVGPLASLIFGIALLFAGVSSSMTAAIAGGTTFSGYVGKQTELESKWFKAGMVLTILPAAAIIMLIKDSFQALILSQVCLSVQLPLTMLPLFLLTNNKSIMGKFANRWLENTLMVITGIIIVVLNALLIYQVFGGKF